MLTAAFLMGSFTLLLLAFFQYSGSKSKVKARTKKYLKEKRKEAKKALLESAA